MSNLEEFLKSQKSRLERVEKERREMLAKWLENLDKLFDEIESWLEPAKKEGLEVRRQEIEVFEEFLGRYSAPVLEIVFADARVRLEPVARRVVGALGRVDVYSPLGVHKLVLLSDGWYLVFRGLEDRRPLTQETFESFLQEAFSV